MVFKKQQQQRGQQAATPAYIMGPRILLLLSVLALTLIGIVMIYSASSVTAITEAETLEEAAPMKQVLSQLAFALAGVVFAAGIWKFLPYRAFRGPLLIIVWVVCMVLLVLTWIMGVTALGAQRWLSLGPIGIQPSEFAKVCFIITAACIMADVRDDKISLLRGAAYGAVFVVAPLIFLYYSQSDLGTTVICFIGIMSALWLGEVPLVPFLGFMVLLIIFVLAGTFLVGYRSDRLIYLNPWDDGQNGQGTGYQIIHSYYAFSEGGLFGVGLGNSHEKFSYLPEAETDFVFSIIGEELGMVGALVVIALFLLFMYAGLHIAQAAPDNFGTMLAGSLTIMIVFQAFLNIGCVMGVLPTTGKPLPFISAGGSSLIATFIMVGIILSVSKAAEAPSIYDKRRADLRVVHAERGSSSAPARKSRAS